jgi:hypothetical protein
LPTTTKMHSDFTYLFNIIGMKAFGYNKLIELINSLVGHHELVELNCLVGLNKLIKLITFGHSELIVVGHSKITELTSLVGNKQWPCWPHQAFQAQQVDCQVPHPHCQNQRPRQTHRPQWPHWSRQLLHHWPHQLVGLV